MKIGNGNDPKDKKKDKELAEIKNSQPIKHTQIKIRAIRTIKIMETKSLIT